MKEPREQRAAFRVLREITTRWSDNDVYGHVNNVVYYSYFDTAVNLWLMEAGLLVPTAAEAGTEARAGTDSASPIGLVVETQCRYFAALAFPDAGSVGMRVAQIGTSSVRYELAVFRNQETLAVAQGHFVHVYVDRLTRRPAPLPDNWRERLERLR